LQYAILTKIKDELNIKIDLPKVIICGMQSHGKTT
jgi:hypothetical protein